MGNSPLDFSKDLGPDFAKMYSPNDPVTMMRLREQMNQWFANSRLPLMAQPGIPAARAIGSAAMSVINPVNQFVVNPAMSGMGMPYNPLNPVETTSTFFNIGSNYRRLMHQSRAFMGEGGQVAASEFDTTGLDRFAGALKSIGASRSEALQTMQALVSMSRQISSSMGDATMAVMNFSRATGLDRGAVAQIAGSAALGSNLPLNQTTTTQLLSNMRTLAGGNNALIMPMAQGVQTFREMSLQRGRSISFGRDAVDNATNLMSAFKSFNPDVYGQRPDIAARHMGQMQNAGSGVLLGLAMDVASRAGRSTRIQDVMAAIQAGDQWMMAGLGRMVGSDDGVREMLALSGIVDAPFLQRLEQNPGGLGGGFTPDGSFGFGAISDLAREYTTTEDQQAARMTQRGESLGARGSSLASRGLLGLPGWVGDAAFGVGLTASLLLSKKAPVGMIGKHWRNLRNLNKAPMQMDLFGGPVKSVGTPTASLWSNGGALGRTMSRVRNVMNTPIPTGGASSALRTAASLGGKVLGSAAIGYNAVDAGFRAREGDWTGAGLTTAATAGLFFGPVGWALTATALGAQFLHDRDRAAGESDAEHDDNENLRVRLALQRSRNQRNLMDNVVLGKDAVEGGYATAGLSMPQKHFIDMYGDVFRQQNPNRRLMFDRKKKADGTYAETWRSVDSDSGTVDRSPDAAKALQQAYAEAERRFKGAYQGATTQDPTQVMSQLVTALTNLNTTLSTPSSFRSLLYGGK
jgi:hypothetical protein